jgi:hypothetical protein
MARYNVQWRTICKLSDGSHGLNQVAEVTVQLSNYKFLMKKKILDDKLTRIIIKTQRVVIYSF